jgi:hypothetical protein
MNACDSFMKWYRINLYSQMAFSFSLSVFILLFGVFCLDNLVVNLIAVTTAAMLSCLLLGVGTARLLAIRSANKLRSMPADEVIKVGDQFGEGAGDFLMQRMQGAAVEVFAKISKQERAQLYSGASAANVFKSIILE